MLEIKGYRLINDEKINRALNGVVRKDNTVKGGVMKADGTYDEDTLLAEYDRFAGAIFRGNDKVKTGSFYDFKARKARTTPEIVFVYRVNGSLVEVPDGQELPGIVKATKMLAEATTEKKTKRIKRNG